MAAAIFWLYVLVGPGLAAALTVLIYFGRRRMTRLRNSPAPPLPDPPPKVAIFVPVKDEAAGIEACVRRLLAQDYPADFVRVVVANDRSNDGTGDILNRLAADEARLTAMHVELLPDGWLGKPHALTRAVEQHAGEADWFLFVDSDVIVEPPALRQCVGLAAARGYAMVSLTTGLIAPTLLEKLVAPIAAATWMTTFRASDTNTDNRPDSALANGQFLLIRPDALAAAGGHAAVRDQTCEDVALARRVKAGGGAVRFLLGSHLTRTRMHSNWPALWNGWARNFAGTARHRPLPLMAAIVVLSTLLLWLPALIVGIGFSTPYFLALLAHFVIAALGATTIHRDAGRSGVAAVALALLFPISVVATMALLVNGVRACLGGTVTWRGNVVRA